MVSMRETGPHKNAYAQTIVNAMDFTQNVEHFAACHKPFNPRHRLENVQLTSCCQSQSLTS